MSRRPIDWNRIPALEDRTEIVLPHPSLEMTRTYFTIDTEIIDAINNLADDREYRRDEVVAFALRQFLERSDLLDRLHVIVFTGSKAVEIALSKRAKALAERAMHSKITEEVILYLSKKDDQDG